MERRERNRLVKFLTLVLRKDPGRIGIALDKEGFCRIEDLLPRISQTLNWQVTRENLEELLKGGDYPNEKRQFIIEGDRIRATATISWRLP